MDIRLLGPPGVAEGPTQRTVAGRQGALLAALALQVGHPVSVDRLVAVVWGDDPPADAAGALQQRMSRLRRAVDPDRRGDVLVRAAGGYALRLGDGQVDVRRFERLAAEGRRHLDHDELRSAEATLGRALGLWGGPALAGFSDEPWAIGECQRLEELRLTVVEDRVETRLRLGEHDRAIGELVELVPAHPLRERLRGQLMLGLYRAGRQADALDVYEETRRLLAEELGVDPSPQLQQVHRQILQQDTSLDAEAAAAPAARGNLPAPRTSVVGRDDALGTVAQLLHHTRLLTITGPGGAGKTTLAVEAARRHAAPAHGTWLVELGPVSTQEAVAPTIAAALGLGGRGLRAGSSDAPALVRALADRRMLLLLDNCEHLVREVSSIVEQLLAAAPDVRILATSREPLGVAGEIVWSVPGLGVPAEDTTTAEQVVRAPAVRLLVERARAHTPQLALTDRTAATAATLVRRLDGIPLAIELAAARLRVLSMSEVADGLDDRFRLLTGRVRTAPSRQRTLQRTLDWSWDLLDEPLRRAWAALAVPADRFELRMASALLEALEVDGEPIDVVADLVDRSLLGVDGTGHPTRYRMLESVREYGRQRLGEQDRLDDVHTRHADVVETALASCHAGTAPDRFGVDIDGLSAWLDDARVALRWASERGDSSRVQRLAGLLGWLWLLRGLSAEGVGWLDRGGLGCPEEVDPALADPTALLWALALRAAGTLAPDADRWTELAVQVASTPTDRVLAQVCAAGHRAAAGRVAEAAEVLAAGTAEGERVGGWPLGFVRLIAGQLAWVSGRLEAARALGEDAVALLSAAGAEWAQVHALEVLVDVAAAQGDAVRARTLAAEGLRVCRRQRYPELEAAMLTRSALAAHALGEDERAARLLDEAVTGAAAVGAGGVLADAHTGAGAVARRRGDVVSARDHLRTALRLLADGGATPSRARAHAELAHAAVLAEQPGVAASHAGDALGIARTAGDPRTLVATVEALAAAAAVSDRPQPGVTLLATAAAVRAHCDLVASPPEERDLQGILERLRSRIPDEAFEAAWSAGLVRAAERVEGILAGDVDVREVAAST